MDLCQKEEGERLETHPCLQRLRIRQRHSPKGGTLPSARCINKKEKIGLSVPGIIAQHATVEVPLGLLVSSCKLVRLRNMV